MSDLKAFNAYLDEDPAYQATLKHHQQLWQEARNTEIEVTFALRRVSRLMMAVDVVRQQQFKLEELPEEQDKMLEDFTIDSGEVWFSQYGQAADDIEEAAVAACAMVIEVRAKAKAKKVEAKKHCTFLDYAREQAREAFDKQKEQVKAVAEQNETACEALK